MVYLKSLVASMLHLSWTTVPAISFDHPAKFSDAKLVGRLLFRASLVREVCSMKHYACISCTYICILQNIYARVWSLQRIVLKTIDVLTGVQRHRFHHEEVQSWQTARQMPSLRICHRARTGWELLSGLFEWDVNGMI